MDPNKIEWFSVLVEVADLIIDILAVRASKPAPAAQKKCNACLARLDRLADRISRPATPAVPKKYFSTPFSGREHLLTSA